MTNKKDLIKVFLTLIEDYLTKEMPENITTDKEFIEKAWNLCCLKLAHIQNSMGREG